MRYLHTGLILRCHLQLTLISNTSFPKQGGWLRNYKIINKRFYLTFPFEDPCLQVVACLFFPHEGINFGNYFLKPARMKADTLTKTPLLHSLGLSQNPDAMPRNHRLCSAPLKLQQNKSGT